MGDGLAVDRSSSDLPTVRIGIVSWNTADLLDRCLSSLPDALAGVDAEVVVVDNDSTDSSVEVARTHGATLVVNPVNRGYARAMNQALAGTDAPVLIALNPDTECGPGTIAELVRALLRDPDVGLVAPRLRNDDGSSQHSVFRFPSITVAAVVTLLPSRFHRGRVADRWWLEGRADLSRVGDIDWAIGAVHVMRASAVGPAPYDERWFMYVEDLDLCWRLESTGWRRRFEPSVEITHTGNAAGAQAWGSRRDHKVWAASYDVVSRHRGRTYMRAYAAVNAAGVMWMQAVRRLRSVTGRATDAQRRNIVRHRGEWKPHLRVAVAGPDVELATTDRGLSSGDH